jgi:hypothetical protein
VTARAAARVMWRHYGGSPLHLLALVAAFALAGYAASAVAAAGQWRGFAVWFAVAIVGHDLLLFPLYSLADLSLRRLLPGGPGRGGRTARAGAAGGRAGPGRVAAGPAVLNYVRVPGAFSLLVLLVWFPLILGLSAGPYHRASGLSAAPYLGRWLGVTGVMFAVSAACYAVALRRRRPPRVAAGRGQCDHEDMASVRFRPRRLLRRWRWSAVVAGAAVLCAIPGVVAAFPVPASPLSAAALRARIMASARLPYSGYVESTADLGLPQLPDLQDVSSLADGVTEQYAWYRSPAHWRADTLTSGGENDVYQVGATTYLWNFSLNLLTQIIGPAAVRLPRAADLLPPALAVRLLGLASRADRLRRLPSRRIAGVDAAGLQLRPASAATTVGAIDVWADPRSGLPVEVRVYARGGVKPVLDTVFLQVSQHMPALATVVPHPSGAVDIATASLSSLNRLLDGGRRHPWPPELGGLRLQPVTGGLSAVGFYGTGYGRLALLNLPGRTGRQAVSAAASAGAGGLAVTGGTEIIVATPLLTVDLATADRFGGITFLLAGSVTPKVLEAAAGDLLGIIASFRPMRGHR